MSMCKNLNITTRITIFFMLGFFITKIPLYAQNVHEVVSTAGGYHISNQWSLSWTIGECIIEPMVAADYILTSGFQQSELTITSIAATDIPEADVLVYPNPVENYLTVETVKNPQDYTVLLYDLNGNLLYNKEITTQKEIVDMRFYASGSYLVRIVNSDNSKQKFFQIIKH